MANNIDVKDAGAVDVTLKTTDNAGVHTPHHNVDNTVTVVGPTISTSSAITNQITVTTAGTRVRGTDITLTDGVFLKAHPSNTGIIYVGLVDVDSSNGFPLGAGEVLFIGVSNLNELYFDASVSGEKVCWIK
jgi:hypothetical protein